jgi:hypothetical protein
MGQCSGMSLERRRGDGCRAADPQEEARRNGASLVPRVETGRAVRRARCCSWPADEAEAVLVNAAGPVARSEEVQFVDHVVVATGKGFIDPGSLQDRQFEGSRNLPPCPSSTKFALLPVNRIENEPPGM